MTRRPPRRRPVAAAAAAAAAVAATALGCASPASRAPVPVTAAPPPTPTVTATAAPPSRTRPVPATAAAATAATASPPAGGPVVAAPPSPRRRPVVVLDPGHNGGNATHLALIDRPVYAGLGQTKPCNTVGAQTDGGYPEHAFTFDVALRARRLLAARGVAVLFIRADDAGVGPCVDARARFGNDRHADAVVSVHADSAPPAGTGFHVIEAARAPAGSPVAARSRRLALAVRAALRAESGLGYASYVAGGGLDQRTDLAGLNLATRPAVFVECGNMHNRADAARLASPAGRQRIARALADGILAALAAG